MFKNLEPDSNFTYDWLCLMQFEVTDRGKTQEALLVQDHEIRPALVLNLPWF